MNHSKSITISPPALLKASLTALIAIALATCVANGPEVDNQPPAAFALSRPLVDASEEGVKPAFVWQAAIDPDGDAVRYDVLIGRGPNPSEVIATELTETAFIPDARLSHATEYFWKVVAKDGLGGEMESDLGWFTTRALRNAVRVTDQVVPGKINRHASVVFDNKLWILGGSTTENSFDNRVWYSEDGSTWTEATAGSVDRFTSRQNHAAAVFEDKMWVIGGTTQFDNDVWNSDNGATWEMIAQTNEFQDRSGYTVTAFNGKLWVIGGHGFPGGELFADVWSSADGNEWEEETALAGFTARVFHQTVAFQDALWVIGGVDDNGAKSDIWRSEDGKTWNRVTPAAAFPARIGHKVTAFDGRIWLVGGRLNNDVWFSEDGELWKEITPQTSYPVRGDFTSVVHDEKLWIMAGGNDATPSDVWFFDLN